VAVAVAVAVALGAVADAQVVVDPCAANKKKACLRLDTCEWAGKKGGGCRTPANVCSGIQKKKLGGVKKKKRCGDNPACRCSKKRKCGQCVANVGVGAPTPTSPCKATCKCNAGKACSDAWCLSNFNTACGDFAPCPPDKVKDLPSGFADACTCVSAPRDSQGKCPAPPPPPPAPVCDGTCRVADPKPPSDVRCPNPLMPPPASSTETTSKLLNALLPGGAAGVPVGYTDFASAATPDWTKRVLAEPLCSFDYASMTKGGLDACQGPGCKIKSPFPKPSASGIGWTDVMKSWIAATGDSNGAPFAAIVAAGEGSFWAAPDNPTGKGGVVVTDPSGQIQMTGLGPGAEKYFDLMCKVSHPDGSKPSADKPLVTSTGIKVTDENAYSVMNNPCCNMALARVWMGNNDADIGHRCMAEKRFGDTIPLSDQPDKTQCNIPAPLVIGNTTEWLDQTGGGLKPYQPPTGNPPVAQLRSANSINWLGPFCHIGGGQSAARFDLLKPGDTSCAADKVRNFPVTWDPTTRKGVVKNNPPYTPSNGSPYWWGGGQVGGGPQGLPFPHYYYNAIHVRLSSSDGIKGCGYDGTNGPGWTEPYCAQLYKNYCGPDAGDNIICTGMKDLKNLMPAGVTSKYLEEGLKLCA